MPRIPGFCGPTYRARTPFLDLERSVNFYPGVADAGTPKVKWWTNATPGKRVFAQVAGNGIRGIFAQDGKCFFVSGTGFYELLATGQAGVRGVVAADSKPATMVANGSGNQGGHQLMIISGGNGYIFDLFTEVFTPIVDADFPDPAEMGAYIDGYFIALLQQSIEFRISALLNGLSWDGLDVGQVSESSDNKIAMRANHRELWLFGTKTTEVWRNTGNASFPFAPIEGVFIEHGIAAPFSAISVDNTMVWLGRDNDGHGVCWRADGYTPSRISTHAVEYHWQTYARIDDAEAWSYQEDGHTFYVLYFPSGETTWVYDFSTQQWHERAIWIPEDYRWAPDVGRNHAFAFGKHLVGDRQSGTIYEQSLSIYEDQLVVNGGL